MEVDGCSGAVLAALKIIQVLPKPGFMLSVFSLIECFLPKDVVLLAEFRRAN